MKSTKIGMILLATLLLSETAHARLGESVQQLQQRYGSYSVKYGPSSLNPNRSTLRFRAPPFIIDVLVEDKIAIQLCYLSKEPFSDSLLKDLIARNISSPREWKTGKPTYDGNPTANSNSGDWITWGWDSLNNCYAFTILSGESIRKSEMLERQREQQQQENQRQSLDRLGL